MEGYGKVCPSRYHLKTRRGVAAGWWFSTLRRMATHPVVSKGFLGLV